MAVSAHVATSVMVNALTSGIAPPAAASSVQSPETLADAIDYLDHHGGGEVTFASTLSGHIIELTHVLPTIDEPITIQGPGDNRLGVDGRKIAAKSGWMVTIASGIPGGVKIAGLELTNRAASGVGGGVYAASPLTLDQVEVRGNVNGGGDGAGVYATSPLTVDDSRVSYNKTSGDGGAIFARSSDVKIADSTFINDYGVNGAAIADLNGGAVTISGSTFTADFASGSGGAIYAPGTNPAAPVPVAVTDSTIVHDTAKRSGGAIDACNATVTVTASTLFKNHAPQGDGISQVGAGSLTVRNTILADTFRTGSPELDTGPSVTVSVAFSLVSDGVGTPITSAGGNIVGYSRHPIRPILTRLGYHGGSTMTMPPRPASLAIDDGYAFGVTTDQLGARRTVKLGRPLPPGGDGTDIGAVEQQTRKPAFRRIKRTFGDQRVRLWVPAGYGCPAPRERFAVRFTSQRAHRSSSVRFSFMRAELWIGRGIRHAHGLPHHVPNATSRSSHASWPLVIRHAAHLGGRKLRLILHYRYHYTVAGRARTRVITRTVHSRLNLC